LGRHTTRVAPMREWQASALHLRHLFLKEITVGFDITAYNATRMKAEASHTDRAHWVDITVTQTEPRKPAEHSTITLFLDTARKADAYANAINKADAELHPADAVLERSLERVREEMAK
jgi:hypothetical protein